MSDNLKFIFTTITALLLIAVTVLLLGVIFPMKYVPPEPDKAITERMKYHGTMVAECDGNECWFYRKGKRAKL